MNTKIIVGIIIVIALAALGYFMLTPKAASSPSTSMENQAPGTSENGSAQAGKLNIVAICQGALAYMSFPDSTSADLFVQECIEGKHPEVIAKWKQDNGITDDRAI